MRRTLGLLTLLATAPTLVSCSSEQHDPKPRYTGTLAEAEWRMADRDVHEGWCIVWRSQGEEGIRNLPFTAPMDSERNIKDFIKVIKKNC